MNYQRIHDQIIERAKSENRKKGDGVYYERHHIVPRCMNGTDNEENLVLLTAREHFIVHKLLCEIYPTEKSLYLAVWMFSHKIQSRGQLREYRVSAREYERLKKKAADYLSCIPVLDDTRKKMSKSRKGKKLSKQHRQAISKAHIGKKQLPTTDATKKKQSIAGKRLWNEKTDLEKQKHVSGLINSEPWNRGFVDERIQCEYCNKTIAKTYLNRHKCSLKPK